LNHYIGMKTLHNEDFFEFTILPYIIVFFVIAFIAVALIAKRKWLNILFVLFVLFGIVAMIDFWRWEYSYGHDLDPNAAIVVPGMAYQPPLIGFKQLLNFGAYSIPDIGGWIFIGAGLLLLIAVVVEWRRHKRRQIPSLQIIIAISMFSLSSCNTKPEAIQVGVDNCYFCKMTITDKKFGAELVTKKGKVFKFDDAVCLISFHKTLAIEEQETSSIYFVDFNSNHQFIPSTEVKLLTSESLRSPMNGNIAAFSKEEDLQQAIKQFKGEQINWNELFK
nr:nitrous oxide reductase accessory protein NosL [Chitinophagaceae bacterium]